MRQRVSSKFRPILSRQTAAHRGACLVINLPGKPASIETASTRLSAVPYCLDLIGAATLETDAAILKSSGPNNNRQARRDEPQRDDPGE